MVQMCVLAYPVVLRLKFEGRRIPAAAGRGSADSHFSPFAADFACGRFPKVSHEVLF